MNNKINNDFGEVFSDLFNLIEIWFIYLLYVSIEIIIFNSFVRWGSLTFYEPIR